VPGVGLVKQSTTATVDTTTTTTIAELRGYFVDGVRRGVGAIRTVVDGLSPGGELANPPLGNPVVGSDGAGFLVVARKVTGLPGSYLSNWVAQRVAPDGAPLGDRVDLGPPTPVSDPTAGEDAAIVFDGVDYLVVHEQDEQFTRTGLASSLVAVRVSPQGAVVGSPSAVVPATVAHPSASEPALAFDGARCLVCFVSRADDGLTGIAGVFVSPATGQADGAEFPVTTPGDQSTPALAFNGTDYLAVWAQAQSGAQEHGVLATRISRTGAVLDADGIALRDVTSLHPAVGTDGLNFLVLWADTRSGTADIYGNRISPAGQRLDGDEVTGGFALTASAGRAEFAPTVTFLDGEYVVAWMTSPSIGVYDGLHGARVSTGGAVMSPGEGGIALTQPGYQGRPVLAAASGSALLIWFESGALTQSGGSVGAVSIYPFAH
jgi:hypothetical protein